VRFATARQETQRTRPSAAGVVWRRWAALVIPCLPQCSQTPFDWLASRRASIRSFARGLQARIIPLTETPYARASSR
jgi:hypothetical protein